MVLVLVIILWTTYCVLHSFFITPSVVNWMQARLGDYFRYYRIGFNLFAMFSLSIPLYYTNVAGGPKVLYYSGYWVNLYYIMVLLSIVVFGYAIFSYDWEEFFGFKQLREGHSFQESTTLSKQGALNLVRHPLYLAALLYLWAGEATWAQLVERIVLTVYILIGIQLEEKKLISRFGDSYQQYRQQVPMLIPSLKILRILKGNAMHR